MIKIAACIKITKGPKPTNRVPIKLIVLVKGKFIGQVIVYEEVIKMSGLV